MTDAAVAEFLATPVERADPGRYSPRERLLRALRGQATDRLPIAPTGTSPFTWHTEFDVYHPVLRVAQRHCEFFATYRLGAGLSLRDPASLEMTTDRDEHGGRKTRRTTLQTPKGELTEVRIHDKAVGSWATSKFFITDEDDLARWESLPFEPYQADVSDLADFHDLVGDAGVVYINGVHNALIGVTINMDETFRVLFCHGEKDRLERMVRAQQQRVLAHVEHVLGQVDALNDARPAAAEPIVPVFRFYAIEPFVEPIQPPSFIDRFVVPYDREVIDLIHNRGGFAVMHCHGRLKAQVPRMVQIGVDGVDCVESPPANDATLAEMMQLADGRLFLWGYIQFEDLAHQTPEQVSGQVRDAVAAGGTDGRYILGQAASPWMADLPGNTQSNWIRMIETGVEVGGHSPPG